MLLSGKKWRSSLSLMAFCAPALVFYLLFLLYPMICAFFYSFTNWNGVYQNYKIVGFKNYIEAFTGDQRFINSLTYTIRYVVVIVVFQNVFAMMIALLVESCKKTKGLFRTLFFMPNILSLYISSLMWSFIFSRVFPQMAEKTIFTFLNQPWLGNANVAFFSILIVSLWHGIGYLMVIYIAALQGIPSELVEAATIDGATKSQNFRYIVFPLLMPAVTVCLFLTLNGSFKIFDSVYSLTNGGPGYSTEVIALNIYKEGFTGNQRFGLATAKSIILFFIIMVITIVQVSITKRREVEL